MSLNADNAPQPTGGSREPCPVGPQYARLVKIIDLGLQRREFAGEVKAPAQSVNLTFELPYQLIIIEENDVQVQKPRWVSMDVNILDDDRAKFKAIRAAFDPSGTNPLLSNWLGICVNIQIGHKVGQGKHVGRIFERIESVAGLPAGGDANVPPLFNPTVVFDFDAPDAVVFQALPDFLKARIRNALNYDTIAAVVEAVAQPTQAAPAAQTPAVAPQPAPAVQPAAQAAPAPLAPVPAATPTTPAASAPQPAIAKTAVAPAQPPALAPAPVAPTPTPQPAAAPVVGEFDDDSPF